MQPADQQLPVDSPPASLGDVMQEAVIAYLRGCDPNTTIGQLVEALEGAN